MNKIQTDPDFCNGEERDAYLLAVLVLVGGSVLDFDLLLQVVHSIAQLQVVRPVTKKSDQLSSVHQK